MCKDLEIKLTVDEDTQIITAVVSTDHYPEPVEMTFDANKNQSEATIANAIAEFARGILQERRLALDPVAKAQADAAAEEFYSALQNSSLLTPEQVLENLLSQERQN